MNNKINNPLLKQLISEIASKANSGRINDLSWGAIYEAKKKKKIQEYLSGVSVGGHRYPLGDYKKQAGDVDSGPLKHSMQPEAFESHAKHMKKTYGVTTSFDRNGMDDEVHYYGPKANVDKAVQAHKSGGMSKIAHYGDSGDKPHYSVDEADEKKEDKPEDSEAGGLPPLDSGGDKGADAGGDKGGGLPPLGGSNEKPKDTKAPEGKDAPKPDAAPAPAAGGEEDADKAEADAAEAKARLAKAKAEKNQAEKEIEQDEYVKLDSTTGTKFLLGKILDKAFKTNTIDSLAGEMVEKLKIRTPEDMSLFSEDMATYMTLPGMPELISSMKTLATQQPEAPAEAPSEPPSES